MKNLRSFAALTSYALLLSACAGGVSSPQQPAVPALRPASAYNIYWSKGRLHLPYPPQGVKRAVLTFWAPYGYMTSPYSCDNGSKIAITHGKPSGNSSGYEHVIYSFRAKNAGPDTCSFDAILNDTGSPPIAIIHLIIEP